MTATLEAPAAKAKTGRGEYRRTAAYAAELWARWPRADMWPETLDLCEGAAYLRVNYTTLYDLCTVAPSDGRARLAHQRIGLGKRSRIMVRKAVLDRLGAVESREGK